MVVAEHDKQFTKLFSGLLQRKANMPFYKMFLSQSERSVYAHVFRLWKVFWLCNFVRVLNALTCLSSGYIFLIRVYSATNSRTKSTITIRIFRPRTTLTGFSQYQNIWDQLQRFRFVFTVHTNPFCYENAFSSMRGRNAMIGKNASSMRFIRKRINVVRAPVIQGKINNPNLRNLKPGDKQICLKNTKKQTVQIPSLKKNKTPK